MNKTHIVLVAVTGLFLSQAILSAQSTLPPEPEPVLVVLEQDPWLAVIGSDSPTFALYDDGKVVYLSEKPQTNDLFRTRIVPNVEKTREGLIPYDLTKMADRYELSAATDQVTTVIWTPSKKIVVYGNWRKAIELSGNLDPRLDPQLKLFVEREKRMWESLPSEIRSTLLRLDEQRRPKGRPWVPAKIEVMFWPYEYAPEESIIWPKDWPGLHANDTRRRGKDSYSVYLPSEKWTDLRKFLATQKEKGAVLIDGEKMAASFRFPFPGEATWMK